MFEFVTAGESHGKGLVAVISGIPAGVEIELELINRELARRQAGYGRGGRMKIEKDKVSPLSGIRHGKSLGSPITFLIENRDWPNWQTAMSAEALEASDEDLRCVRRPRPGHADLAGALKYGARDLRNILERSSARETTARVAVGALGKLVLRPFGVKISSHTVSVGPVALPEDFHYGFADIEAISNDTELRCLHPETSSRMLEGIKAAHMNNDTIGGCFEVWAEGVCPGLGSHTAWDRRLDGWIAQAMMSIPAVKAVEIGAGIRAGQNLGSQVHDEIFYDAEAKSFWRATNNAGGVEGGISNGSPLVVRGHIKPIPTLRKPLRSVDIISKEPSEAAYERSDTCVVPGRVSLEKPCSQLP